MLALKPPYLGETYELKCLCCSRRQYQSPSSDRRTNRTFRRRWAQVTRDKIRTCQTSKLPSSLPTLPLWRTRQAARRLPNFRHPLRRRNLRGAGAASQGVPVAFQSQRGAAESLHGEVHQGAQEVPAASRGVRLGAGGEALESSRSDECTYVLDLEKANGNLLRELMILAQCLHR